MHPVIHCMPKGANKLLACKIKQIEKCVRAGKQNNQKNKMKPIMRLSKICMPVFFATLMITSNTGCYYDKEELLYSRQGTLGCASISAKFSTDVSVIIKNKCATSGCHDASGSAGGSVLVTFAQVSAAAARIKQRAVVDKTMPSSGPLSVSEVSILKCWIDSGTPNN